MSLAGALVIDGPAFVHQVLLILNLPRAHPRPTEDLLELHIPIYPLRYRVLIAVCEARDDLALVFKQSFAEIGASIEDLKVKNVYFFNGRHSTFRLYTASRDHRL